MGQALSATIDNDGLSLIVTAAGANALIKLYNGTRPALGGAVTSQTLIAEAVAASTLGTVANRVLTLNAITGDVSANATGTPTWVRVLTAASAFVGDFDISGFPTCTVGEPVDIDSFTLTAPST